MMSCHIHHGGGPRIEGICGRPHPCTWKLGQDNNMPHSTYRCHAHKLSRCGTCDLFPSPIDSWVSYSNISKNYAYWSVLWSFRRFFIWSSPLQFLTLTDYVTPVGCCRPLCSIVYATIFKRVVSKSVRHLVVACTFYCFLLRTLHYGHQIS
jgi:hypothetical protein